VRSQFQKSCFPPDSVKIDFNPILKSVKDGNSHGMWEKFKEIRFFAIQIITFNAEITLLDFVLTARRCLILLCPIQCEES